MALDEFLDLLRRAAKMSSASEIEVVVDVRSTPYSRFTPQFDRNDLEKALREKGMKYLFLGRELGGRPRDPSCYDGDRVDYFRVPRTPEFREGIARLVDSAARFRVAVMCAEKDPLDCHRGLLIAPALEEAGVSVVHILPDDREGGLRPVHKLERHDETMERLVQLWSPQNESQGDLFAGSDETSSNWAREWALRRQARKVAYVRRPPPEMRKERP